MMKADVDALVLAKINAPHSRTLSADDIAFLLSHPAEMRSAIGPMSSFFYELDLDLQQRFAQLHEVSPSSLRAASDLFDQWSGARRVEASIAR
jgi:hypothetical protein